MTLECFQYPGARIAVFAKAPVAGRVKTRLSRTLGVQPAAYAYKQLLRERMAALEAAALAPLELWVAPHAHPFLSSLARRYGARLRTQPRGDLGARMMTALGGDAPSVVIGGDCAGLPTRYVGDALAALYGGARVVLAPAADGGYTMVGARSPPRVMFRNLPWGSPRVMALTRQRLTRHAVAFVELPLTWDVDDYADWRRWRRGGARIGRASRGPYR